MRVYNEILGKYIEIPKNPRIISLAPSITDTLIQLNAWDNVVGISIYCEIPEGYKEKPRVGAYLKVIYSRLEKLRPDLILLTTGAQRNVLQEMIDKGYNVYPIPLPISVDGILDSVYVIGNLVRKRREALELIRRYREKIFRISKKERFTVYYEVDLGGPISVGGPTYISSGLYTIGLVNIFLDEDTPYFEPDFNRVLDADPDLIIYEKSKARDMNLDKLISVFKERGWEDLKAFKERNIIILEENTLAHYGPKFIDYLENLNGMIDTAIK